MNWLLQVIGTALIILAIADVYLTVLYPRGDKGIVSVSLARRLWCVFRVCGRCFRRNRDRILSYMGPTLLVVTVAVWISLLLFGFALIYLPALGNEIQNEAGNTPTNLATAIYYSGYSLATLGTGDITPRTSTYRLLMILEAILGFSIFTMTLTYFESIYSQLIKRNVFALSLYHRTHHTGDAAEMLARFGASGSFDSSTHQDITNMAQSLMTLLESNHSYPALSYFRLQEPYYAIARVLFVVMDTVALIQSALNEDSYRSLVRSAGVSELEGSGMQFLHELSELFVPSQFSRVKPEPTTLWRDRYYRALERLEAEGIKTVTDREAGADLYISLRREWNADLMTFARYMEYEWSAIACSDTGRVTRNH